MPRDRVPEGRLNHRGFRRPNRTRVFFPAYPPVNRRAIVRRSSETGFVALFFARICSSLYHNLH